MSDVIAPQIEQGLKGEAKTVPPKVEEKPPLKKEEESVKRNWLSWSGINKEPPDPKKELEFKCPQIKQGFENIKKTNWQEKIDQSFKIGIKHPEFIVPLMQLANLEKPQIISYLYKSFSQTADSFKLSAKRLEMSGNKREADYYDQLAKAYYAEVAKMDKDPGYAFEWYQEAEKVMTQAKDELSLFAREIDSKLQAILGSYKKDEWQKIGDRIVISTPPEYEEFMRAIYGEYGQSVVQEKTAHT